MPDFVMVPVPRDRWPVLPIRQPDEVWLSDSFLVQLHREDGGMIRLTVSRRQVQAAARNGGADWCDGISWDELQAIKRAVGYAQRDALELFPADRDLVNVANMRHLWIPPEPVAWAWRSNFRAS